MMIVVVPWVALQTRLIDAGVPEKEAYKASCMYLGHEIMNNAVTPVVPIAQLD